MAVITVFKIEGLNKDRKEVVKSLNVRSETGWFSARESKFSRYEVFIQYYFYEDVEDQIKRMFGEDDEIVTVLKNNGKTRILKRVICFISYLTKTLEIYRGPDKVTQEIARQIERILQIKLKPLTLKGEELVELYKKHGIELKQAMFKHIEGLMFETLKGSMLEANAKFRDYLEKFKSSLRVISFRPNIRYLNGGKYQITVNGDKGTIKFSEVEGFKWRPRVEIRQLVFLMAATAGWLGD